MFILQIGTISAGFQTVGPFETIEAANEYLDIIDAIADVGNAEIIEVQEHTQFMTDIQAAAGHDVRRFMLSLVKD